MSHSEVHFEYRKQAAPMPTKSTVPDDEIEALEEETNKDAGESDVVDDADMVDMSNIDADGSLLFGDEKAMRNTNVFKIWPNLSYTQLLIFCYLGCVWLRWPIMLADLQR